jgi:dTDP-glucose 4,6-dehydratase
MTIIVTGGAGFIGSNFIRLFNKTYDELVINYDLLTYAGNLFNLEKLHNNSNYKFIKGDIADRDLVTSIFNEYSPRALINFAAESHVDRSIHSPKDFIDTNIMGTFNLLECTKNYLAKSKIDFKFLHVSTDEVYGSLNHNDKAFTEKNQYQPNSPYSASKASSDHLVRAFNHTYDVPTLITNCSNNYGPYQFPEKLIPLIINNCLDNKVLPIYGKGDQIRDWLYVEDHCLALDLVLNKGVLGEVYNIGGDNEQKNIDVVNAICEMLDKKLPRKDKKSYKEQIKFVDDRPGHDKRYAIDASKIKNELGWSANENFKSGLEKTISWYLENTLWCQKIKSGEYLNWIKKNYQ